MSTPNVIIYPQSNNVVVSAGTDEEVISTTYSVNVSSFPAISIVNVTDNTGISVLSPNFPPASSNAVGTAGELRWDSDYLYVCVSNNLWKKILLSNL